MATEPILISSSPVAHEYRSTTPQKVPTTLVVPSTSSPASEEVPFTSRHFPISIDTNTATRTLAALVAEYAGGAEAGVAEHFQEQQDRVRDTEADVVRNIVPCVTSEGNRNAKKGSLSTKKAPEIRRKRSKLTEKTDINTSDLAAGGAPGSKWRANKRVAQKKPEDDGEFLLDQSHKLYMMHFRPDLFYSVSMDHDTIVGAVDRARQNLEFVMEDLTADIAEYLDALRDAQRRESEAAGDTDQLVNTAANTKPKRKRRSLKDVKDKEIARALRAEGRKQRAAAKKLEASAAPNAAKGVSKCKGEERGSAVGTEASNTTQPKACKRKRDWTPPHDSFMDIDTVLEEPGADMDYTAPNFTGIVKGFALEGPTAGTSTAVPPEMIAAKPPVKRGRSKKSDTSRATAGKTTKTPAKPALPKKPKTVTGMALEAYQPAEAETPADNRISHFFRQVAKDAKKARSQSPDKKASALPDQAGQTPIPHETVTTTPATKPRARKSAKIAKEQEVIGPKLLSPAAAARRISDQDFMFGTSSQLIREEDAEGLLEIQQALRQSFLIADFPRIESEIVNRTQRGLWSAAGEQEVDQTLLDDLEQDRFTVFAEEKSAEITTIISDAVEPPENAEFEPLSSPPVTERVQVDDAAVREAVAMSDNDLHADNEDRVTVDIDGLMVETATFSTTPIKLREEVYTNLSDIITSPTEQHDSAAIIIPSSPDIPLQALSHLRSSSKVAAAAGTLTATHLRLPLSPPSHRPALRNLSTNTSPRKLRLSSPNKALVSTVSSTETSKRPKGRPRKNSIGAATSTSLAVDVKDTSRKSELKIRRSPSFKADDSEAAPWMNIDDIEDSEPDLMPSPPRGSQTRQLPTAVIDDHQTDGITVPASGPSIPATTSKRTLSPRATKAKSYGLAKKETSEAGWAATAALLFPQIARTIKTSREPADPEGKYVDVGRKTAKRTTKASNDSQASASKSRASMAADSTMPIRLSWYEKMLMYDPIVIEDLTDFLVAKGVIVSGIAEKNKDKTAGKSKAKDLDSTATPANRALEPWMVQRWCEEHSICCLWRASLVGGTRARY